MSSINKVVLSGGMTRDPELRYVKDNMAVVNFTVAVEDQKKNTSYIDCVAFGGLAEKVIGKFGAKGKQVIVAGRINQEKWQDKQSGQNRSKLTVVVEDFEMHRGGGGGNASGGNNSAPQDDEDMPV